MTVTFECIGGPWDGQVLNLPPEHNNRVKISWFARGGPREPYLFSTLSVQPPQPIDLREGWYRVEGSELLWEGER